MSELTEELGLTLVRVYEDALGALSNVLKLAAEGSAADAVEWVGDWLNDHDAVGDDDARHYDAWEARGRP